jgi:hypothetical protein
MRISRLHAIGWLGAALASGCGTEIGDSCSQNVDCSPTGGRICDVSQPDGYCTIEGCDEGTCPEEAICVRFFPAEFLVASCAEQADCQEGDLCLSDGFCAPLRTERRYCMRRCGTDGACRDEYSCQRTGLGGTELAQDFDTFGANRIGSFCAPSP